MKWISNFFSLVLLLTFASCGKQFGELSKAPTTQNQIGIIASCTTKAQAQEISEKYKVSFRVINKSRQLIEFVGLSESQLTNLLPKAKLTQNKLYDKPLVAEQNFGIFNFGNVPFYGAHSPQYRESSASRYFPHLEQVGALNLNQYQGQGVTIAIIDTGVYYNHPHLSPNIKTNTQESQGSSNDNDNNGFKGDYAGWDFYNGDAYPIDDNGHGTHVAGLAASTYSGIAPKANILAIKVLSSSGQGDLGTIAQGISYAIDMGADIINLSLGGDAPSSITSDVRKMLNAISTARSHNSLVIAASGNGGADGQGDCNDEKPIFPANIDSDNIISVAAVDLYNKLTSYSNFGVNSVDIAAPGGDQFTGGLLSTVIPNCNGQCSDSDTAYSTNIGTSMATPVVAGLAALIKSKFTSYSYLQIRDLIESSGMQISQLQDKIKTGSVISVSNALSL